MSALRFTTLILLLAPLACGDNKSTTTEEASTSSSGTTGESPTSTTGDPSGIVTSTDPMTTSGDTTGGAESTTGGADTTGEGTSTGGVDLCAGDNPHVMLVTSLGEMVVALDAVNAPNTVANFIEYVEAGFYDGAIFHRVIPDFVLQGGGFTTELMQKPTNPPIALEISPNLIHVDGAIAMARTTDPDSATSQFYICDGPQPDLDGMYAVFGVLVSGFEVRDAIAVVQTQEEAGYTDVPVEDVIVEMAYCVAAP
jgi:peptidyl-prolyl cis-trans isomerase A (cyclophilin A)